LILDPSAAFLTAMPSDAAALSMSTAPSDTPAQEGAVQRARNCLRNRKIRVAIKALVAAAVVIVGGMAIMDRLYDVMVSAEPIDVGQFDVDVEESQVDLEDRIKPIELPGDGWVGNLNKKQLALVEKGERVLLQRKEIGDSGGRGTAVCDIKAPRETVMKVVTNFDRYAGRLAQCTYSRVYGSSPLNRKTGTENIKVHMKLWGFVKTFNCFYDHTVTPKDFTVTWHLDPTKKSDFEDVQGQWYVGEHPKGGDWTRVWYTAEVALPKWIPRNVVELLCRTGGMKALQFVREEAEALIDAGEQPTAV